MEESSFVQDILELRGLSAEQVYVDTPAGRSEGGVVISGLEPKGSRAP